MTTIQKNNKKKEPTFDQLNFFSKGKSTSLSAFFRVAKNWMSMFFKDKSNPEGQSSQEGHGGRGGRGVAPAGDLMGQPDLKEVED